ncbi:MAG: hypothetical protein RIB60_11900 [Phycisphaerales bacterium]
MNFRERIRALDRFQQTRGFKIGASIAVLAVAIAVLAVYFVTATSPGGELTLNLPEGVAPQVLEQEQRELQLIQEALSRGETGGAGVTVGVTTVSIIALVAVWFGLGLTYLALTIAAFAICGPLYLNPSTSDAGRLFAGVIALTMSFTVLLRGLRAVFSLPGTVFAIARNTLAEAVRLKLSMVFIVMLVFALAAMPLLLNDDQPLRHRVQAFTQYATGGGFWIIAVLVLFFSVATVSFEQRDKVIWQTMTKPVASWQYLLGKWLGVSGLAAVLLAVSSTGVFMFTAFLANQTAVGEIRPHVPADESANMTEDRMILTTQVLAARKIVPPVSAMTYFELDMDAALEQRIAQERRQNPDFTPTNKQRREYMVEIYDQLDLSYKSIHPIDEGYEGYVFEGLSAAKESDRPIILRYKINAEGNRPDKIYNLTFQFPDGSLITRRTGLGFSHTLTLTPDSIQDDGALYLRIYNGELRTSSDFTEQQFLPNPQVITFPPDGLEVSYSVGSYHMNFVRVVAVLWVKLAFLIAVGIFAATFLSFPIAALLAIGTFLVAESASWTIYSLESFSLQNHDKEWQLWRYLVANIARGVGNLFTVYAELRPTRRLSTGLLLSWSEAFRGTAVLMLTSVVLYALGVLIFRRRELATYSGQ